MINVSYSCSRDTFQIQVVDTRQTLPISHLASLTPCLSQAYEASSNREDAAAADVCMAALYLTVDRPNDAHAFFQRAQSRDSTVANEETLMQLVSDFRAAPTAAPPPPSPPSCPVSAHKRVPLPLPAALGAAGISRREPLCARQVSSCVQQGGLGCGQASGARLASQSDMLYTNTVLVRALCCPLSILMHSYESLLAGNY